MTQVDGAYKTQAIETADPLLNRAAKRPPVTPNGQRYPRTRHTPQNRTQNRTPLKKKPLPPQHKSVRQPRRRSRRAAGKAPTRTRRPKTTHRRSRRRQPPHQKRKHPVTVRRQRTLPTFRGPHRHTNTTPRDTGESTLREARPHETEVRGRLEHAKVRIRRKGVTR